jgi:CheY-like chemotaxis protein
LAESRLISWSVIFIQEPREKLKILIVDGDEDNLSLYSEYLSTKGHQVVNRYLGANNIITKIEKDFPDICLIDYGLPGAKNGIDLAIEILEKNPSAPILFITGYELLDRELSKHPIFRDKKIKVLLKPVKLDHIENSISDLAN